MRGRLALAGGALGAALGDRRQRRVQLAWGGTITAEWVVIVALGVWAFAAGGPVAVGLMTLARTLPAAVFGPFLAPIADRYRRDRVLAGVTLLRALLVAGVAAALLGGSPTAVVYVLAALDALVYTLYWPAQSSLLAELARRPEELVAANVTSTTLENVGGLAGPALGALALGLATTGATVATSAVLLCASSAALLTLVRQPRAAAISDASGGEPGGLLAGFRHLAATPRPRLVSGLYLSHTFALGGLTVLIVVLALDGLGLRDSGVGLLTAGMGAGGVAGSLAALGLVGHPRLARALATGVLAWAVATGLLGAAPHAAVAVGLLAAGGMCNALVDVAALTLLQRLVPERLLGRVLGVVEGVWWGTLGVGGFLASILAAALGVRAALGILGGALALLAVALRRALGAVDATATAPHDHLVALLRDRILAPMPTTELERLALAAVPVEVAPGEAVVRMGDVGDRYYVIARGVVEVTRPGLRARLTQGDGFGEVALLRDVPRTATVTAVAPTALLAIDREVFLAAVRGHQRSAAAAAAVVAERYGPERTGTP